MQLNTVKGRVKSLVPESGYVERCPECDRVTHNNHCVVHVDETPEPDLRLKARIDGYDEVVVVNSDLAEDILGIGIDEAEALPESDLMSIIKNRFIGREFEFHGRTLSDNFIVNEYERRD